MKEMLRRFLVLQVLLIFALRMNVMDSLSWLIEILPPLVYLMHVLFIAYDQRAFPEYRTFFVQVLAKCGELQRSVLPHAAAVGVLLGIWVSALATFVDVGSAVFAGAVVLLALSLDLLKGWVGAKSVSCWILQCAFSASFRDKD